MNACSGSVCILQDICRVRSAEGGRVCAVEERWPPGWQRHTHHSPTCSDVAPPPLGPQCRRPLHRREWQTCASHTQVTTGGWVQHGHIQRAVSNFRTFKYFYELEKKPLFVYVRVVSYNKPYTPCLMFGPTNVCLMRYFQRWSSRQCQRWWQQKVIIKPCSTECMVMGFWLFFLQYLTLILLFNVTFSSSPLKTAASMAMCRMGNIFSFFKKKNVVIK